MPDNELTGAVDNVAQPTPNRRHALVPGHTGAALLRHLNIRITRGYVAVFGEHVVTGYTAFLATRPPDEYRDATISGTVVAI